VEISEKNIKQITSDLFSNLEEFYDLLTDNILDSQIKKNDNQILIEIKFQEKYRKPTIFKLVLEYVQQSEIEIIKKINESLINKIMKFHNEKYYYELVKKEFDNNYKSMLDYHNDCIVQLRKDIIKMKENNIIKENYNKINIGKISEKICIYSVPILLSSIVIIPCMDQYCGNYSNNYYHIEKIIPILLGLIGLSSIIKIIDDHTNLFKP